MRAFLFLLVLLGTTADVVGASETPSRWLDAELKRHSGDMEITMSLADARNLKGSLKVRYKQFATVHYQAWPLSSISRLSYQQGAEYFTIDGPEHMFVKNIRVTGFPLPEIMSILADKLP